VAAASLLLITVWRLNLFSRGIRVPSASFSLQYPSFLFPGKSQFTDEPAPEGIPIRSLINSVNPLNWLKVGRQLRREKPDLVVVRFWLPFMGPAFGTILRQLKKNRHTKVVCIADNVIPHEKRPGDRPFTRYFLKSCDAFITMSERVFEDLRTFEPEKPAIVVPHPLYDNFGHPLSKKEARQRLGLPENGRIILFFGFIRQYKGLDILLRAMADKRLQQEGITLLIAGEFYEDETPFKEIIAANGLQDYVVLRNGFIPDRRYVFTCQRLIVLFSLTAMLRKAVSLPSPTTLKNQ
jgi:glycosyltransferase involved in cell wall biosynthesis